MTDLFSFGQGFRFVPKTTFFTIHIGGAYAQVCRFHTPSTMTYIGHLMTHHQCLPLLFYAIGRNAQIDAQKTAGKNPMRVSTGCQVSTNLHFEFPDKLVRHLIVFVKNRPSLPKNPL